MENYSHLLVFLSSLLVKSSLSLGEQLVEEDVFISHLPDARVMAHFEFKTTWHVHPLLFSQRHRVWHYGVFPKSLAEVVAHYRVQELHLALTQGKWRTRVWGYPPYSTPPGAELWAWFLPNSNVESDWAGLVNGMSGLLCAHLNAVTLKSSYQPLYSFRPHGAEVGNVSSNRMRYAALPRETVCTENFTPWTKLLPCGSSAGLGTLFSSQVLFDTDYHSLGLHFEPVCLAGNCSDMGVQLKQTLTIVFPPSIRSGYVDWTLKRLFGSKVLRSACPLASRSRLLLSDYCPALGVRIMAQPSSSVRDGDWLVYYIAKETANSKQFNLRAQSESTIVLGMPVVPVLTVQRYLSGSGRGWGGLNTDISNNHPTQELRVLYLDMVPWFCRVFLHTFHVENAEVGYQRYQPAKDRQRPHMLELLLQVPPLTTASISIQFNRAFLKWTEHPPDANHGFYINSAVLTTVLDHCPNCTISYSSLPNSTGETGLRVHTESLLVSLPTPDFSMPYNVICFVCTVIAIGFGSVFNLVTRRLEPVTDATRKGLIPKLFEILRQRFRTAKKED